MSFQFRHSALSVVAAAMADVITPPPLMTPTMWATKNLIVPDGPHAGAAWSLEETPYLQEPLDMMASESPVNEGAFRKSAQIGASTLAIAAIMYWIACDPSRMMIIQPTDAALADFNRDKLAPSIEGSEAVKRRVQPQTSRSGQGSTSYSKRFPGGSLSLAISTSAADLRSKTIKKLIRDEIDQYPDDLDGQGDPLKISDGRLMSFLAAGDWKKLDISTPTILGRSKIDKRFKGGDQRYWCCPCPSCGEDFRFEWGPNLRYERSYPYNAYYVTPCCGHPIAHAEKKAIVRRGRWIATVEEPGRYPSWHFDTLSSNLVKWDDVVKAYIEAGQDERELKTFANLWLGLPYEIRGDAPDHVRLMERREPYGQDQIPAGALFLTASSDVQMRGIWYEIVAWGRERQSWVIAAGYIDGSTEAPTSGDPDAPNAFDRLKSEVLERKFPDAWGRKRTVDALAVDSGYRSHVVYAWARAHQRPHADTGRDTVLAVKGEDGWGRPALGLPKLVDIDLAGRRIKQGCKVWAVGTWPLKGAWYADLRKEGIQSGAAADPEGYCHFGSWLDEVYFRQITAEYLSEEMFKGRERRVWKVRASDKDNHLLDCRVYNMALAEHLGLTRMTADDWAELEVRRGRPQDAGLPLFAAAAIAEAADVPDALPQAPAPVDPAPEAAPKSNWMQRPTSNWMSR